MPAAKSVGWKSFSCHVRVPENAFSKVTILAGGLGQVSTGTPQAHELEGTNGRQTLRGCTCIASYESFSMKRLLNIDDHS